MHVVNFVNLSDQPITRRFVTLAEAVAFIAEMREEGFSCHHYFEE